MKKSSSAFTVFISLLLFLSFSSPLSSANAPKCHPHDQKVVQEIKTALGINPIGDCCDPSDPISQCGQKPPYRVHQLGLFESNFSGQIPAAIGDLPYLKHLTFDYMPNLIGRIPPSVSKLSSLQHLSLTHNNLSGPIPAFLAKLKKLEYLDLSFNSFSGSISPELSQLKFTDVSISNNHLTGTIPKSFGNSNFSYFDLSYNNLAGDASFLLGKNKTISNLFLRNNKFMFDLSKVEFPDNLTWLDLSHNYIFGSIPQQVTQNKHFEFFNVCYNKLCGEIPQGRGLQKFDASMFVHNKCLCGAPLPACKRVKRQG